MNSLIDRVTSIGINPENASFSISTGQLLKAINEEVDFEGVTDHELREIVFIVNKALNRMNWQAVVAHAIKHLPFGLSQTGIAWDGIYPCGDCPDALIENSRCCHDQVCKAWEIYEARF